MKKLVIAIALGLVSVFAFAGCGANQTPTPQGGNNTQSTPAQTAKYFDPNLTYTPRVGEEDVETVVLRGESDTAVETVTYYFVNNVYSRQETVTEYATEEGAKNAYPQISHHEDAKIEGNTVSFKFVSYAFQEMSRDEVRNYWQDLFDSAPEFYANYSISIVDKAE